MLLFGKLVDETQISKPQKCTDTFRQILTSIFLSIRAILKETVQCETPCIIVQLFFILKLHFIKESRMLPYASY